MSAPGFGGRQYTGSESRALTSIAGGPGLDSNTDFTRLLQQHDSQIKFLAANQKKLQQGVNEASQNPIQQLQQFVADIIVLLGGGQLAEGLLDFGDLRYILPTIGALFGLGEGPFPLDLFQAAQRFFLGYVVPTRQFTDVINNMIGAWLNVFGIDAKFVKDTKALITAIGDLFDGVANLLPSTKELFTALGITAAGLGPLGAILKPIIDLFAGIDLTAFGNAIDFIVDAIDPWVVQLTAAINFLNEVLRVLGAGGDVVNSPLPQLTLPFRNLVQFLGNVNFAISTFDPIGAAQQFISRLLIPVGSIAHVQPNLQLDAGFDDSAALGDEGPAWTRQYLDPLIDDPDFVWDLIGHTADGSATVHATGTEHGLLGTVLPVQEGQTFDLACWALWDDVVASGESFALQVMTDGDDITDVAVISDPAASGGWTQLAGSYTVPAGVASIRIRLCVKPGATEGQVWFDDATIRRTSLFQKGFVEGLVDDLLEIFGNFAAMIDGILGTGHTFGQLVTFIGSGLSTAAAVADNLGAMLSGLGLSTLAQLGALISNVDEGVADAADAIGDLFDQIGAMLSGAGTATTAALGELISNLLTMLNQIADIFNGGVVTPVNTAVQQVQDWFAANLAYLANIPNTAVQGLTGFGTNIGNSVQALSDGVWQGLRAFLGIPAGVGPPQVSSAAQQVRVDLNNASDIATAAALFQAKQSISKQSYLSIDPSADPVFPLSNITGASPSTVAITQAKSAMGVIGLPDNGLKKSLVWLGGSLTNITAVYVNIYKVNTTTGEFTRTHRSANIIGSLTSPAGSAMAWQFYNLPMTDFFPTLQGEWYVAEIQVLGTGTYNVVGITNSWMPTHTSVYPKALGASRSPSSVSYDTKGAGYSRTTTGASLNSSFSHTVGDGFAPAVIVDVIVDGGAVSSGVPTYDGVNMTLLSSRGFNNDGNFGSIYTYGILDVAPNTTKTVAFNLTLAGSAGPKAVRVQSFSHFNVASFGTPVVNSGGNVTSISSGAVTSATGQMIHQVFASQGAPSYTIGSYNQTSRENSTVTAGGNMLAYAIGDAAGAASVTFTATQSVAHFWASVAVPLLPGVPAAPSSISSPTYDANVPWLALAGAAGRAQHAPETVEFETAGTHTYNLPAWIEEGDYIDIVPIGGGAGGSYIGERLTTLDLSYKGGGAAQWNPIRLRYGDDYDIPTGTTSFTVNVGDGGAAPAHTHPTHNPVHGSDGEDTTVVITGYPTITAASGVKDGSTLPTTFATGTGYVKGDTPGDVTHEGVKYFGGGIAQNYGSVGNSPGGGGYAGYSSHQGTAPNTNWDYSAGAGAPGACYITASQNV